MSYAKTFFLANLTRDPELRVTPKGTATCSFGIAVNRKFKDEAGGEREEVSYFDCEAWGKTAENIAKFFTRGRPIFLECRPKLDQWEDKNTKEKRSKVKFVVEQWQFAGGDRSEGGQRQQQAPRNSPSGRPTPAAQENLDEDVPF